MNLEEKLRQVDFIINKLNYADVRILKPEHFRKFKNSEKLKKYIQQIHLYLTEGDAFIRQLIVDRLFVIEKSLLPIKKAQKSLKKPLDSLQRMKKKGRIYRQK